MYKFIVMKPTMVNFFAVWLHFLVWRHFLFTNVWSLMLCYISVLLTEATKKWKSYGTPLLGQHVWLWRHLLLGAKTNICPHDAYLCTQCILYFIYEHDIKMHLCTISWIQNCVVHLGNIGRGSTYPYYTPPATKLGGYTGNGLSVCPSVRPFPRINRLWD